MSPLLLNAARAFAMVSFSDGRLSPAEAQRFAHIASKDMTLGTAGHAEIADAWTLASNEVHAAQSFGSALIAIRTEITSDSDKAVLMRIAQAASVADGKLEAQENQAIFSLAEALGLDPKSY
jgi:tellurite resistance protein